MNEDQSRFELNESGNFLRLTPIKQNFPDSKDSWDRNWIEVNVEFKIDSFRGNFNGNFMTLDFENFKQQLRKLYSDLKGYANFESTDNLVKIQMKGDGIGHIEVNCAVSDDGGFSKNFEFKIEIDQTQIPDIINDLNQLTKKFPIEGIFKIKNEY